MSEERKSTHPEVSFLPPLKMVLAFFERESRTRLAKKDDAGTTSSKPEVVKRIIDRLNEEDRKND